MAMSAFSGFAFYDFDGTLVSSNVVTQYLFFARQLCSPPGMVWRYGKLLVQVPWLLALEHRSRRRFNLAFYRHYRGMSRESLERVASRLFEQVFEPALFAGARALLEADRAAGFRPVLVSGSPDFALAPVVRRLGFDHLIANRLVFNGGVATGELAAPIIAGREKVAAMEELCRKYNVNSAGSKAYSDSISDLPMLEAVGSPCAVNPDLRLRRVARQRGWPVLLL